MDSMQAFATGQANCDKPLMVFDWDEAAKLIRERQPKVAKAGLRSDRKRTGGTIYRQGVGEEIGQTKQGDGTYEQWGYPYLSSIWAVPELDLDGEVVLCYRMQDEVPEAWGEDYPNIYWPESAVAILKGAAVPAD